MRAPLVFIGLTASLAAQTPPELSAAARRWCTSCHTGRSAQAGLDFTSLPFDLNSRATRERWIRIHDRVEKGETPPNGTPFRAAARAAFLKQLEPPLRRADLADAAQNGRGPMRRLNRDE